MSDEEAAESSRTTTTTTTTTMRKGTGGAAKGSSGVAAAVVERRKRKRPVHFDGGSLSQREEKLLAAALRNSLQYQNKPKHEPRAAPVLHPDLIEFADPLAYIAKIRSKVEKYGICKIVPPRGWSPPFCLNVSQLEIPTKLQRVNRLGDTGRTFTFDEYYDNAVSFRAKIAKTAIGKDPSFQANLARSWESLYWTIVEGGWNGDVAVEYGNDISSSEAGSGFSRLPWDVLPESSVQTRLGSPQFYQKTGWNLTQTPRLPGSVLRHLRNKINGINVPWLYFGMPFSTFSWHNEDNHLHSINYMHISEQIGTHSSSASDAPAEGKVWYGIAGSQAELFEECLKQMMPERFNEDPDLIYHLTTMVSPPWLMERGVEVCRLIQAPGEFVVTFPAAYHAGFSLCWNVAEAVNFGTLEWLKTGRACRDRYRRDARDPVIAHDKLTWSLASLEYKTMTKKSDLELILEEMKELRNEEAASRERAQLVGIRYASRMPSEDEFNDEPDCKRQCIKCKHPCSFSAAVCSCSPGKVVCLHHIKDLCGCENKVKCLVYWKSVAELDELIAKVEARLEEPNQSTL